MIRYAIVKNARTQKEVEAYLPANYRVVGEVIEQERAFSCVAPGGSIVTEEKLLFVIEGTDKAGWTLDGYVSPRLASGLIYTDEIDLSHPVMKVIPIDA